MTKARICILDIETSPIQGYTWTTWDANVLKILEPSKIISISWKWLGEEEVFCKTIADYKGYKKGVVDDEKLIKDAWKILDEADIVVAHSGKSFDLKKLMARFIWYSLPAPSKYQIIDTKLVAKKHFLFDSNSLDNLGQYLNCGKKIENGGFGLWVRCMNGDKDAWALMAEYNIQDVILLEKVYLKLRPYHESHPNVAMISGATDGSYCPVCQSENVQKRGFSYSRTGTRQRYQCKDCGAWSSGSFTKSKSSNILYANE